MLVIGWVLGLAALSWYFAAYERRQINPNELATASAAADGALEVTLQRNAQGHYVASGAINGVPATFLLDTGATHVSVPADLARRSDLVRGAPSTSITANGPIQVHLTRIESMHFAGIELHDVRASINPGMHGDFVLLGMSALKRLEFTQRGDGLILRQF